MDWTFSNNMATTSGVLTITATGITTVGGVIFNGANHAGGIAMTIRGSVIDDGNAYTLVGGGGSTDVLSIALGADLDSTELSLIGGWETWTLGTDAVYSLTLDNSNSTDSGTLAINAYAVKTAGNLTINASAESTTNISLTIDASVIANNVSHTLTGGGGSSDALAINALGATTLSANDTANIGGWETWTLGSAQTYDMTLSTANAGTGTLTIDGTASSGLTVDGVAETDAAASLIISGGAGIDSLTGGSGADTMTGNASADTFTIFDPGTMDTIADFSGVTGTQNDIISFDLGDYLTASSLNLLTTGDGSGSSTDTGAGPTVSFETVSDITSTFTSTAGNEFILFSDTNANSASAIQTALQGGGLMTFSNAADTGAFLAAYDTGTVTRIAAINVSGASDTTSATVTDILELSNVTDVTTLNVADFTFI